MNYFKLFAAVVLPPTTGTILVVTTIMLIELLGAGETVLLFVGLLIWFALSSLLYNKWL